MAGAYQRLDGHEDVCAERYLNIHGRIDLVVRNQEKAEERREQDRNWLRTLVFGVLAWLALQVWEMVTDRLPPARPAEAVATATVTTR